MRKKLRLYVWEDVLTDWTAGVMFALATDAEHARELIRAKYPGSCSVEQDLNQQPAVYEEPFGLAVWGGG